MKVTPSFFCFAQDMMHLNLYGKNFASCLKIQYVKDFVVNEDDSLVMHVSKSSPFKGETL
jgi:hypothetical protein